MTVASGTSTPTSITVVAISNCVWPEAKRAMAASFSAPFLRRCNVALLGFLDQRADPIGAAAVTKRTANRFLDIGEARQGYRARIDRLAACRLLAQFRDIHVAEEREHQRARDRRCGEY